MHEIDTLVELLRKAQSESALAGEGLEALARGLRERAALVLDERLVRAEAEVRRLAEEIAWRRETIAGQEAAIAALEREIAWRRETVAAREVELATTRDEREAAAQAHDRLLAHHRDVLGRVAIELAAIGSLPLFSLRSARKRLASLAVAVRGDTE